MSIGDDTTSVEFRHIEWCPGYGFHPDGSVWSSLRGTWRKLKPSMSTQGYRRVALKTIHGMKWFYVQRLILEAFRGPCPEGCEACHDDGDAINNHIDNLRWDTRLANVADMKRHGVLYDIGHSDHKVRRGEEHASAILAEADVVEIRNLYASGTTQNALAARYGIKQSAISGIISGERWKHAGGVILSKGERHAVAVRNRKEGINAKPAR